MGANPLQELAKVILPKVVGQELFNSKLGLGTRFGAAAAVPKKSAITETSTLNR